MAVIAAFVLVLGGTPLTRSRLGGDDGQLRILSEDAVVDAGRVDAERPEGADVDLLQLLLEIEGIVEDSLLGLVEVASVVDDRVDGAPVGLNALNGGVDRILVGHVDAVVHVPLANELGQLGAGRAAEDDGGGPDGDQLLGDGEAEPAVPSGDEDALSREVAAVVHGIDVEEALVAVGLGLGEAGHLVGHGVGAPPGLVEVVGGHGEVGGLCGETRDGGRGRDPGFDSRFSLHSSQLRQRSGCRRRRPRRRVNPCGTSVEVEAVLIPLVARGTT
mmetsp:Transcript_25055/g.73353  ORF Transcript_25055/g.73353 Transcript_25055/m.73353 type:complete len:274 (-) Transcript_25055:75-896(-)